MRVITFFRRDIFNNIGEFASMNREFANCYLDSQGRDIQSGKLTWLIVVALQRARRDQIKVLEQCYGQPEPEKARKVKEVSEQAVLVWLVLLKG